MKILSRSLILFLTLSLTIPTLVVAADAAPVIKVPVTKVVASPAASSPVVPEKTELAVASPVAAEKTAEVSWWKVLLSHLMEVAFALLGLLLSGLVTVLMKKYGFESQSARINELLGKSVGYAEQKAVKASKLGEGTKTSGAEKMELAVQFAEKLAKDYKVKEKGKDWWEMKLESWMGEKKNGA